MRGFVAVAMLALFGSGSHAVDTVGVKTEVQYLYYLTNFMNLSPVPEDVVSFFNSMKTRLPKAGLVAEVTPTMLAASTSLSAMTCGKFLTNEAALKPGDRLLNANVDFKLGADQVGEPTRKQLIAKYVEWFLLRSPTTFEMESYLELMNEGAAPNPTQPQATTNMMLVLCAAVSSAIDALVF